MTPEEFKTALEELEAGADIALPLFGHGELVPIADLLVALAVRVTDAVVKRNPGTTLAAEVKAARAATDAAETAKFGPGGPKT
jgi:hypothetical protein